MTLTVTLMVEEASKTGIVAFRSGENNSSDPTSVNFPQIRFAYSCLAEGTNIRLADGPLSAIENVGIDQLVDSGSGDLTVVNTSIGVERIPMIRLETSNGYSLLLTEGHPVITPDRGALMAADLTIGDRVTTEDGDALVERLAREQFDGKVHNLKLGAGPQKPDFDPYANLPEGATMYANGILVGDGRMQGMIQDRASRMRASNTIETRRHEVTTKLPVWEEMFTSVQNLFR